MSDIKKLGELVDKTVKIAKTRMKTDKSLQEKWGAVVDREIMEHTEVKGIRNGILYVRVDSATWMHYIAAFKKEELLHSMRKEYRKRYICDIRFHMGN